MSEGGTGAAPGATLVATVKRCDPVKGYGFLTPADGSRDLFCHVSAVGRAGLLTLAEGTTGTCEVEQGRQGPQVERIHSVDASTASSVPAASGRPASPGRRVVASVKWFVAARGFGFLTPEDGSPDVFCHVSVVEEAGYGTLAQGTRVTCEVAEGRKGPVVSTILDVDTSAAAPACAEGDERWRGAGDRERDQDDPVGPVEEHHGLIKFYNAAKGYGFVVLDDGGQDVFLHGSVLNRAGLDALEQSRRVSVMVAQGPRGPQATDIALL